MHLRRVEANLHFPVIEFMSLLLKYTIKQVNVTCLSCCSTTYGSCGDGVGDDEDGDTNGGVVVIVW